MLELQQVQLSFGNKTILQQLSFTLQQGEIACLLGHSGCGKSTLLNLIAGLTTPTNGALLCANKEIKGPGPERAVVFQNHSLLPWLTCFDNIYLAVDRVFGAKESKAQLKARADAAQMGGCVGVFAADGVAVEGDLAAAHGFKTGNRPQGGGFAAAGMAE